MRLPIFWAKEPIHCPFHTLFDMKRNTRYYLFIIAILIGCKKESVFRDRALTEVTIAAGDSRLAGQLIHFSKDTVYILQTNLTRDSGQTLSIDAGTLIKVADRLSITINPGASIEAKGTATEPVVFTSSAETGAAGPVLVGATYNGDHFWFGIRIYGNDLGLSSGTLSYVRIEFAGKDVFSSELGSLLLNQVNKETIIDHIQVSYSYSTCSFEFSGGDVNAENLVSYASGGTDFYIHQGYKGMLQHLLGYRLPYFPLSTDPNLSITLAGLLLEDSETFPVISNLTILGPGLQRNLSPSYTKSDVDRYGKSRVAGLITTGGSKFHIGNSVFLQFPKGGWFLDDLATGNSIIDRESDFTHSIVHSNDSARAFYLKPGSVLSYTSEDFRNFMLDPVLGNQVFADADDFMLTDPYNYNVNPDPLPKTGSPLLTGAGFDGIFSDPFFKKVDYRGALGGDNWMKGWTNFIPLQTSYNN